MEPELVKLWIIPFIAFFCEYMDSTLGMGYGTTLTPIFLLMGYAPMEIVPAILVSELVSGALAGLCHHKEGNINLKPRHKMEFNWPLLFHPLRLYHNAQKAFPLDLKISLLLSSCSILGAGFAIFAAVRLPQFWLKLYIGVLVLSMGVLILAFFNRRIRFSVPKIFAVGIFASFNKALSGGGYGPVVTAGQMLSGIESRSAVGITSVSESVTCLVGVLGYLLMSHTDISWHLAPYIVCGAALSVPLSAKSVRFISEKKLKIAIALLTIALGSLTIIKTL